MAVLDDLLSSVTVDLPDIPAQDVLVGLFWTAVYGQRVGLAATPTDTACCFASDVNGVGGLHQRTVNGLASLLHSTHPLEVTIGMAALNSLIEVNENDGVEMNARDVLLERGRGKTVVTVGHFPFTDALREVAAQLWVLELNPTPGDQPAEAAGALIPQADVIGLTASTLLNGTFESLSRLFPSKALVVMLGPSTPLSNVLFDYGVHILGGALVTDPATALRYIGQGSSLHRVPGIRRFTLVKR
jgi:uncharacterized protein